MEDGAEDPDDDVLLEISETEEDLDTPPQEDSQFDPLFNNHPRVPPPYWARFDDPASVRVVDQVILSSQEEQTNQDEQVDQLANPVEDIEDPFGEETLQEPGQPAQKTAEASAQLVSSEASNGKPDGSEKAKLHEDEPDKKGIVIEHPAEAASKVVPPALEAPANTKKLAKEPCPKMKGVEQDDSPEEAMAKAKLKALEKKLADAKKQQTAKILGLFYS